MPYIAASTRPKLDNLIDELSQAIVAEAVDSGDELNSSGALNYATTRLYLSVFRTLFPRLRYSHIALITGILENVKQEFYRKVASPFEDDKCFLNGEIPEYEEFAERV